MTKAEQIKAWLTTSLTNAISELWENASGIFATKSEAAVSKDEAFPSSWRKNGTMAQLISDINNDTTAVKGRRYFSTVGISDLPSNMIQAEMEVRIMDEPGDDKVILFTVTSSDVSPYHWEYTSSYGASGSWRSYLMTHQDISGKADRVTGNSLNNHIAALDANGNLKDSGKTITDFPTYASPTVCQLVVSELT